MPVLRPLNLIAIASALPRDTLRNIRETHEFVVNVIPTSCLKNLIVLIPKSCDLRKARFGTTFVF
jgi:flavin reductase (DIM6/NTAB) family NADH-FMN oxidoreductase RutF